MTLKPYTLIDKGHRNLGMAMTELKELVLFFKMDQKVLRVDRITLDIPSYQLISVCWRRKQIGTVKKEVISARFT